MIRNLFRRQRERVERTWGEENIWTAGDIRHWLQHPLIQTRLHSFTADASSCNRYEYFINHYLKDRLPVERALTLGSGNGELERGLCHYNFAKEHVGIDISSDAMRKAQESAVAAGHRHIVYREGELNSIRLEPEHYDVVFGVSSIHHVEKLEHLFEQVRLALKPGGYLFMDEYIGPNRFQWTDEQLRLMNDALAELPDSLKQSVSKRGETKHQVIRKTVADVTRSDPSEAVRSSEIMTLLPKYFRIVEFKGYGGGLIHELLYDIAGNFKEENAGSLERLQELCKREDELMAAGKLGHDFAVIIAST